MTAARSTTSARVSSQPSPSSVDAVLRTRPRTYVILAVVWIVLLIAGLFAPYVLSLYNLQLAVQSGTLAIIALSVGWLLRQTGPGHEQHHTRSERRARGGNGANMAHGASPSAGLAPASQVKIGPSLANVRGED